MHLKWTQHPHRWITCRWDRQGAQGQVASSRPHQQPELAPDLAQGPDVPSVVHLPGCQLQGALDYYFFQTLNFLFCFGVEPINGASLVAQRLKCLPPMPETQVWSLGREDPLEKEMVTHSSILAWRIPWMEKPGRLQSMGSQRVGHEWTTSPSPFTFPENSVVKNLPANARNVGLIPGLGRSPGEGNGNLLQYSCLENPMDRGAWWARGP